MARVTEKVRARFHEHQDFSASPRLGRMRPAAPARASMGPRTSSSLFWPTFLLTGGLLIIAHGEDQPVPVHPGGPEVDPRAHSTSRAVPARVPCSPPCLRPPPLRPSGLPLLGWSLGNPLVKSFPAQDCSMAPRDPGELKVNSWDGSPSLTPLIHPFNSNLLLFRCPLD